MTKKYRGPIKASRLIKAIKEGVEAEIVDAEGVCEKLRCIDIDYSDGGGVNGLTACCYWPEDTATCGLDFGSYELEVLGVVFRAHYHGPYAGHGDFEIGGRDIAYDKDPEGELLTEEDVVAALEEFGDFPEYESDGCELDVDDLSEDEICDGLRDGDGPAFFAHDADGELYCYNDESDIPEDYERVDFEDAYREIAAGGYMIDKHSNC